MEDFGIIQNMDSEILAGMEENAVGIARMGAIRKAAINPTKSALESENVKTGIAEAVKKLDQENQETFPEKEDTAETTISSNTKENKTEVEKATPKEVKRILGMKPLTFGVVLIGTVIGGYLIYKKTIK